MKLRIKNPYSNIVREYKSRTTRKSRTTEKQRNPARRKNRAQANIDNAAMLAHEQPINLNEIMYQQLMHLASIEANTRLNAEKTAQFYDKFNQFYNNVVVPNPNGDTAFGIKTIV